MKKLEDYVATIPDFPAPGIMFRDVTTVIADPDGFALAMESMRELLKGVEYDAIAAIDARGFIFGAPLALENHVPLLLVRKKGKLPRAYVEQEYQLEYGSSVLTMHTEDLKPGMRVVIVDDLIATGGSAWAAAKLVEKLGGTVTKMIFMMELKGLKGREFLSEYEIGSAIQYEGK